MTRFVESSWHVDQVRCGNDRYPCERTTSISPSNTGSLASSRYVNDTLWSSAGYCRRIFSVLFLCYANLQVGPDTGFVPHDVQDCWVIRPDRTPVLFVGIMALCEGVWE